MSDAADRAAAHVRRQARAAAERIMATSDDPTPPMVIVHGHVRRPRPVTAHATVHADGRVEWHVGADGRLLDNTLAEGNAAPSLLRWFLDQPDPTTPRGGIQYGSARQ